MAIFSLGSVLSLMADPDVTPLDRLSITVTFMLTATAYSLVVASNLPTLGYLTFLDEYAIPFFLILGQPIYWCTFLILGQPIYWCTFLILGQPIYWCTCVKFYCTLFSSVPTSFHQLYTDSCWRSAKHIQVHSCDIWISRSCGHTRRSRTCLFFLEMIC